MYCIKKVCTTHCCGSVAMAVCCWVWSHGFDSQLWQLHSKGAECKIAFVRSFGCKSNKLEVFNINLETSAVAPLKYVMLWNASSINHDLHFSTSVLHAVASIVLLAVWSSLITRRSGGAVAVAFCCWAWGCGCSFWLWQPHVDGAKCKNAHAYWGLGAH